MKKWRRNRYRLGIVFLLAAVWLMWPAFGFGQRAGHASRTAWLTGGAGTAYASGLSDGSSRVFDYAGLFDSEETALLEEKAGQMREDMKVEAVVLTVEDAGGRSAAETADRFYFENGFSDSFHENGLVMLIDMDNRELYLGTYGSMIRI
ncbi:MAG: TPM domain-containing protein, partial [Lachnospiraceae bacterium]|nr:TPM domain-containing protein [Lachnospiraceae bacterium]